MSDTIHSYIFYIYSYIGAGVNPFIVTLPTMQEIIELILMSAKFKYVESKGIIQF